LTSKDGKIWGPHEIADSAWLTGVAYASDIYIGVGEKGAIVTSKDGVKWSSQHSGTDSRG
jgi:hypothetical protein